MNTSVARKEKLLNQWLFNWPLTSPGMRDKICEVLKQIHDQPHNFAHQSVKAQLCYVGLRMRAYEYAPKAYSSLKPTPDELQATVLQFYSPHRSIQLLVFQAFEPLMDRSLSPDTLRQFCDKINAKRDSDLWWWQGGPRDFGAINLYDRVTEETLFNYLNDNNLLNQVGHANNTMFIERLDRYNFYGCSKRIKQAALRCFVALYSTVLSLNRVNLVALELLNRRIQCLSAFLVNIGGEKSAISELKQSIDRRNANIGMETVAFLCESMYKLGKSYSHYEPPEDASMPSIADSVFKCLSDSLSHYVAIEEYPLHSINSEHEDCLKRMVSILQKISNESAKQNLVLLYREHFRNLIFNPELRCHILQSSALIEVEQIGRKEHFEQSCSVKAVLTDELQKTHYERWELIHLDIRWELIHLDIKLALTLLEPNSDQAEYMYKQCCGTEFDVEPGVEPNLAPDVESDAELNAESDAESDAESVTDLSADSVIEFDEELAETRSAVGSGMSDAGSDAARGQGEADAFKSKALSELVRLNTDSAHQFLAKKLNDDSYHPELKYYICQEFGRQGIPLRPQIKQSLLAIIDWPKNEHIYIEHVDVKAILEAYHLLLKEGNDYKSDLRSFLMQCLNSQDPDINSDTINFIYQQSHQFIDNNEIANKLKVMLQSRGHLSRPSLQNIELFLIKKGDGKELLGNRRRLSAVAAQSMLDYEQQHLLNQTGEEDDQNGANMHEQATHSICCQLGGSPILDYFPLPQKSNGTKEARTQAVLELQKNISHFYTPETADERQYERTRSPSR